MGTTYHYTNLTKREWFASNALGGNSKFSGLGLNLTARAFDLLLVRGCTSANSHTVAVGRWAGDCITLVGDTEDNWLQYQEEFRDIEADVILMLFACDGFERIADSAQDDPRVFMELCHLVVSRQVVQLENHMKQYFGSDFLSRYKQLCIDWSCFQPKNLAFPTNS
jgi:hypothetical protein